MTVTPLVQSGFLQALMTSQVAVAAYVIEACLFVSHATLTHG